MRKRIFLLTTLCFFIYLKPTGAIVCTRDYYNYYPNGLETVTGTIQALGRNSIDIFDELQKNVIRLTFFDHGEVFHKGDYVRISYHPTDNVAQIIKRMTVLDYKKNGQNLGYITH